MNKIDMKITHYICPRGCGKTTMAKVLQMEDPQNTLLVETKGKTNLNSLFLGNQLRSISQKKLIIDEFLFCANKEYNFDCYIQIINRFSEITLFSTPDKLYDPLIFSMISEDENPIHIITGKFANLFIKERHIQYLKNKFDEFEIKFLNPNKVDIILTDFESKKEYPNQYLEEMKRNINSEQYKTNILGEFLKY